MKSIFRKRQLKGLSVHRASICILLFILFVLSMTGSLGGYSRTGKLKMGYKRTVSILNEIMSITEYERDKEDTTGTLIYMYMVDALRARYKGVNCASVQEKVCTPVMPYKTYNGRSDISEEIYSGGLKMAVGKVLLMFSSPKTPKDPVYVMADINGANQIPNRLGYDTFVFQIVDGKLKHMGDPTTDYPVSSYSFYCSPLSTSQSDLLGVNCAYKMTTDREYFKKLKWDHIK